MLQAVMKLVVSCAIGYGASKKGILDQVSQPHNQHTAHTLLHQPPYNETFQSFASYTRVRFF